VSGADLVRATPTSARASFRFLESFQGPFVAVLLPPPGFALRSSVAVSVDVSLSVRAEARVHVTAVREIGREGDVVTVDVRADPAAAVIEKGAVTDRRTREVGWLEDVASETGPSAPVRPGQRAMPQATLPALPGLPPPSPRRTFGAMRSPLLGAE
jgi:hypothetical protein